MDLAGFNRQLAQMAPEQLAQMRVRFYGNNDLVCKLPRYIDMKGGLIQFDENGELIGQHAAVGAAGSVANADNSLDRAKTLKSKFPKYWGNGAYAAFIAKQSVAAIGVEKPLSAKTIRRYFKQVP